MDVPATAGADPALIAAMAQQQAAGSTQMAVLGAALDGASTMSAQLLKMLQAGNPQGVGGSVNTYA